MKKILTPTDFSEAAQNAVNYAAEVAVRTKSSLVLLHAYHPVVIVSEVPVVIPSAEELEQNGLKWLKKLKKRLVEKYAGLNVEIACIQGMAGDAVENYAKEHTIDLIVMGTHGVGYLEEKILGSVTTGVIKNSSVPVLAVDPRSKFRDLKKIVLATDNKEYKHKNVLKLLKELATTFQSHIYALNVTNSYSLIPSINKELEHMLKSNKHSFHICVDRDIVRGINSFVQQHDIDLVIMVPREHSFIQTVFKKSSTKTMAFHGKAPLLTVHE